MSDQDELLAAEMAAVSAVKSQEIVEAAASAAELNEYQNHLDDSLDRVLAVQETLKALKPYEVTPALAAAIDADLIKAEVVIPAAEGASAVEGAECLGRSLMPKDYLFTRLAGCENFVTDFFKKSKDVAAHIAASFKSAYVIFTESHESLTKQLDLLEHSISTHKQFPGSGHITLGYRLFNQFQINGKVDQNWTGNLSKLSQTLAGLSSNYYLNNKNVTAAIFSYFGGFGKLSQDKAIERLKMLPISIPSAPFKECTYPDNEHGKQNAVSKRSVELMGGAYFYDVRTTLKPAIAKDLHEVQDWVTRFTDINGTAFEAGRNPDRQVGNEVKALSAQEIKQVVSLLRKLLGDWSKIFEQGDKYLISDHDFLGAIRGFMETDLDNSTKNVLSKHYHSLIIKHQVELLHIRAAVSHYVTLIINGMIHVCKDSIKVGVE